jgi:hypothetical protein
MKHLVVMLAAVVLTVPSVSAGAEILAMLNYETKVAGFSESPEAPGVAAGSARGHRDHRC